MTREDARETILSHLRTHGKATNLDLIDRLDGDESLFRRVRESLILNDLVDDHKGAGLIYVGTGNGDVGDPPDDSETAIDGSEANPAEPSEEGRPQTVFLSYGREDATRLAQRLKAALEADGHTVWMDQSEIRAGRYWQWKIERAIDSTDITVAVLSPHAVRRPEGICLDEISYARYGGTPIVPVMGISCKPPLGIYRLDWVDMQGWEQQTGRFERALAKLREALRRGPEGLSVEGTHADLFGQLQPIDFGPELSRLQRGFTGRDWVVAAVEEWLSDPDGAPAFLLTGDPGAGKSAIMARLTQKLPQVAALHFCRAENSQTLRPEAFVRSVAAQLATQLPSYAEALRSVLTLPNALDEEPDALFKNLIINPLAAASTDEEPLSLLVDGLDEAVQHGTQTGPSIPRLVGSFLGELATMTCRVRLVLSSRPVPGALRHVQGRSKLLALQASALENRADLEDFVSGRLEQIRGALKQAGTDAPTVTAWLTERADGNFLYAEQALLGIESGRLDPSDPDAFPAGLVGLYASQFERLFPGTTGVASYETELRPLLSVLVAAREPLTAEQVAEALGAVGQADAAGLDPMDPAFTVRQRMTQLAAQYPEREGRYVPFHASVTEWLSGETGHAATDAMTYAVSRKAGHRMLAVAGKTKWDDKGTGTDLPVYFLRYLPSHLLEAEQWEEAYDLLTTLGYVEAKAEAGYVDDLAADLMATAQAAPKDCSAKGRILRVLGQAIEYEMGFLRRHPECVFQVCWNRGWWYDAEETSHFFEAAGPGHLPPWEKDGSKAQSVLESWKTAYGSRTWIRRLVPPNDLYSPRGSILRGHTDVVEHVCWSPNGDQLISVSRDGTARLWNLSGSEKGERSLLDDEWLTCVSWSPSGAHVGIGARDGSVHILNADGLETVRNFRADDRISSLSWSLDGRFIAASSHDSNVYVLAVSSPESEVLTGHQRWVHDVEWHPSSPRIASASRDGTVRIWDLSKRPDSSLRSRVLYGHQHRVRCVRWHPFLDQLASCSDDGTVRIWDTGLLQVRAVLDNHDDRVSDIKWSPNGDNIASSSYDRKVRLWDTSDAPYLLDVLDGHDDWVLGLDWSPDGRSLVSSSRDRTARIWDLEKRCQTALRGHERELISASWNPNGNSVITASKDGTLRHWRTPFFAEPLIYRGHSDTLRSVSPDPRSLRLASVSRDRTVRVWTVDNTPNLSIYREHSGRVRHAAWRPSGGEIATSSRDGTVHVWNPQSLVTTSILQGGRAGIRFLAWAPEGDYLAGAGYDGTVRIWAPDLDVSPLILLGHEKMVRHIAWSPEGDCVASASRDCTAWMWNLNDVSSSCRLEGHTNGVIQVSWSPDGRYLASMSWDNSVRVWSRSGTLSCVLEKHTDRVYRVEWSLEENRLITTSFDGTRRIWCLDTGQEISLQHIAHSSSALPEVWKGRDLECHSYSSETRITMQGPRTETFWFEESGFDDLVSMPISPLTWAAYSGFSTTVFALENPPLP
jgi:WD40 repeat protein